jgi:hypothetical protein
LVLFALGLQFAKFSLFLLSVVGLFGVGVLPLLSERVLLVLIVLLLGLAKGGVVFFWLVLAHHCHFQQAIYDFQGSFHILGRQRQLLSEVLGQPGILAVVEVKAHEDQRQKLNPHFGVLAPLAHLDHVHYLAYIEAFLPEKGPQVSEHLDFEQLLGRLLQGSPAPSGNATLAFGLGKVKVIGQALLQKEAHVLVVLDFLLDEVALALQSRSGIVECLVEAHQKLATACLFV